MGRFERLRGDFLAQVQFPWSLTLGSYPGKTALSGSDRRFAIGGAQTDRFVRQIMVRLDHSNSSGARPHQDRMGNRGMTADPDTS